MLRLLLDAHISPAVVRQLSVRTPGIKVVALKDVENGKYRSANDEELLLFASQTGQTLVTYDLRTIAPLLRLWGEQGLAHSGVIFINSKTICQNDLGGLVNALAWLWQQEKDADWRDRIEFLTRTF
jgi:hypothetical protein